MPFFVENEFGSQMKPLGKEISDFEKGLSFGLSLEQSIDNIFYGLNDCVIDKDQKPFRSIWDSWVQNMPGEGQGMGLLATINFKHPLPTESKEVFPSYFEKFCECLRYGVAAQRAFDRKETDSAWVLLGRAAQNWNGLESEHEYLEWEKNKIKKGLRAASNGGVEGERIRYKFLGLLHKATSSVRFKDIKSAFEAIDREIAVYMDENQFKSTYENLLPNIKKWGREQPAFRAELKQFFVKGWAELEPKEKPVSKAKLE